MKVERRDAGKSTASAMSSGFAVRTNGSERPLLVGFARFRFDAFGFGGTGCDDASRRSWAALPDSTCQRVREGWPTFKITRTVNRSSSR